MSRPRALCVRSAALILPLAFFVVSEATIGPALADPPKNKTSQPNNHGPRPQNDAAGPKKGPKPAPADPNVLSMELKALRILRALEATPHQISEVARTAKKTAGKPGQREPAKVSDGYVEAMVQMRRALVTNDADKIEQLRTQFDQLEEKVSPTWTTKSRSPTAPKSKPSACSTFSRPSKSSPTPRASRMIFPIPSN